MNELAISYAESSTGDVQGHPSAYHSKETTKSLEMHTNDDSAKVARFGEEKPSHGHSQSFLMNWAGPDDPENPHNWPVWQRTYHAIIPSLFCFAMYVKRTLGLNLILLSPISAHMLIFTALSELQ